MSIHLSPDILKRLQQLRIHLRKAVLGQRQGAHQSIRRGHGLEFAEYKSYSPGDDFRSIDWNVLARTDKIYTRQYREEQDVKVLLVLDYSKSLHISPLASQIALAIAYVTLSRGDKVSVLLPGVYQTPWSSAPGSYHSIIKSLTMHNPVSSTEFLRTVGRASAEMKVPGRVIIISDLLFPLDDLITTLEHLYKRNFETTLVEIETLSRYQLEAASLLIDAETNEELDIYISETDLNNLKALYLAHHKEIERACSKYRFSHLQVPLESSLEEVLFTRLIKGGIFR
jgi:uncharacterized protein (DUF58 family)